uniref:Calcium-activated potassium channel subunit beta n=1 Tax=Spermophilus dauricus TaxID=99837 RepID=A0A8C9PU35_SPEDA
MVKKLVMAQKRGETRALCLGVAMVVCAVITYYILCTTMLPLYQRSVWTQESTCHLIETDIRHQEELEGRKVSPYPCLWVNVSAVGKWAVLYHTEDTRSQNQQCSYIPDSLDNYQMARADVEKVRANFHKHQVFYCFSTTQENETSVLYQPGEFGYINQPLCFSLFKIEIIVFGIKWVIV